MDYPTLPVSAVKKGVPWIQRPPDVSGLLGGTKGVNCHTGHHTPAVHHSGWSPPDILYGAVQELHK